MVALFAPPCTHVEVFLIEYSFLCTNGLHTWFFIAIGTYCCIRTNVLQG